MMHRFSLVAVVAVLVSFTPASALAGTYPGNKCVSDKMKETGKYCKGVLKAWSSWEKSQDNAKRDAALAKVSGKLDAKWTKADGKALAKGVDCADTTDTRTNVQAAVDVAIGDIVTEINTGLDLNNKDDAKCGQKLLAAAAKKCDALLNAESKNIKKLSITGKAKLGATKTKVSGKFSSTWAKVTSGGCPTGATENDIESRIDAINDATVLSTIVSPNVDDTQFQQYDPTGAIEYEKDLLQPICSDGSPWHFWVKRGTENKLVMYYQGGGACWSLNSCFTVGTCDPDVDTGGADNPNNIGTGFGDLTNPLNPFSDWNIVYVPYCTCDIHWGSQDTTYAGSGGGKIRHRGFQNSKVAEKFAREHFVNPEVIFVTGSSAGAYGASMHGIEIQDVYPQSNINVLADAGNGVITPDFLENDFPKWGVEKNLPNVPGIKGIPIADLSIPDFTAAAANFYPATKWGHYSAAYDGGTGGQTGFLNVMQNQGNILQWVRWWDATCDWNAAMVQQAQDTAAAVPANYRYYIGSGSRHTMYGSNKVYTDTTGGVPTIVAWIESMIAGDVGWTNVTAASFGVTLPGDPVSNRECEEGNLNAGASCTVDANCDLVVGGDGLGNCDYEAPFDEVGPDVVITCP